VPEPATPRLSFPLASGIPLKKSQASVASRERINTSARIRAHRAVIHHRRRRDRTRPRSKHARPERSSWQLAAVKLSRSSTLQGLRQTPRVP